MPIVKSVRGESTSEQTKVLLKKLWGMMEVELEASDVEYHAQNKKLTDVDGMALFIFQRKGEEDGDCQAIVLGQFALEPILKFVAYAKQTLNPMTAGKSDDTSYVA